MDEKSIITTADLEMISGGSTQSAGNAGRPLPGVTMPTCPFCGSNETTQDVYRENDGKTGKYYKQYKCLICGSYFGEKKEVVLPDQMPLRGR